MKAFASLFLVLACTLNGAAQLDTSQALPIDSALAQQIRSHSTATATWRSVMLPGWGQLYNRKWWKAPVVWAGMGTTIGFAIFNHGEYKHFRSAYEVRIDNDPNTTDIYEGIYSSSQLITIQTTYRRWRDLSIILTVAAYALNILDAHIDAHLFYFDITDDLSLQWQPTLLPNSGWADGTGVGTGLCLQMNWP